MKFLWFAPSALFSLIDYSLARPLALLAGAALRKVVFRYGALFLWMTVTCTAAWLSPPGLAVFGLGAASLGMLLVLGVTRRWSWVERDREAFFVARQSDRDNERVGFQEDLRDEALISLVFLFLLIPLALRQVDFLAPETFSGEGHSVLAWVGYFGAELAKSVPFVDWSEVLHVENGSPIKPEEQVANVVVFAIRAALDLLLIAAIVQAIQLAARLSEQDAAFAARKVDILEPFGERRRLRAVAMEAQSVPFEDVLDHPAIADFPKYNPGRFLQIARQGDGDSPLQAEADPTARWAALAIARRQLDASASDVAVRSALEDTDPRVRRMALAAVTGGISEHMVRVPAGSFWMGAPEDEEGSDDNERPRHLVQVPEFEFSRYPVTFDAYDLYCRKTGRQLPEDEGWGRGRRPVINVNWDDAQAYVSWLSNVSGDAYRLPSESEWEYACRSETSPDAKSTRWHFGDDEDLLDNYAWYIGNSNKRSHPVGLKQPNVFGLYDMHGNVLEWCADKWHNDYTGAPTDGSVWDGSVWDGGDDLSRVLRGGSWYFNPQDLRSAIRNGSGASLRLYVVGFRVARTLSPPYP